MSLGNAKAISATTSTASGLFYNKSTLHSLLVKYSVLYFYYGINIPMGHAHLRAFLLLNRFTKAFTTLYYFSINVFPLTLYCEVCYKFGVAFNDFYSVFNDILLNTIDN